MAQASGGGFSFPTTGGRLLLNPTAVDGGGVASQTSEPDQFSPSAPETPPAAAPPAAPAAPATPTATGATPTSSPSGLTTSPQTVSGLREAARTLGFTGLDQYPDDQAALAALLQRSRQADQSQYYTALGQQIASLGPDRLRALSDQVRQPQAPAAPAVNPWEPPPYDERWLQLVTFDPDSGLAVARPGVDPRVAEGVNRQAEWRREWQSNPAKMIAPLIEQRAREIARSEFQANYQAMQSQSQAQSILQANATWLYQRDAAGNVQANYDGRPQLSAQGVLYAQTIQQLQASGVHDVAAQDYFARQIIAAREQIAANPAAPPAHPPVPARPNVNPSAAADPRTRARNGARAATSPEAGLSLSERMARAFHENGVTSADFPAELPSP